MPVERSAGAIIVRQENNKNLFLLLNYQSGSRRPRPYWDFPKGHIEKGETLEDTVRREVEEETGIGKIEIVPGFKQTIKYFFKADNKTIFKTVVFFLAKTREKEVKISDEHIGFKWLSFEESLKQVNYKNAKDILKKADEFLSR